MSALPPRPRKALVLGHDTRAFLSVVRSLGRHGLEVHAGWCDPSAAAARSRYVAAIHDIPPPSLEHVGWRDRLLEILAREHFDFVVPCNDPAILPLQIHRSDFAPFARSIYLLDDRTFRIAFDKLESYELARSLGIPVPRRVRVASVADLQAALASFSFPILVKPRASFTSDRLGRKHQVRWARSPQELETLVQALLPWGGVAVEERVSGRGAGVEVLAHQGEVLASFQHLRIHEPPSGGGSSYRCSTTLDPELYAATRAFLEAIRYTGVAMLEFKVDPERRTWAFIEINARFWGSLPLALAAGVDFPYWLYQMWVEGRRDFPRGYPTGVYCRNLVNDLHWMRKTWRADRHDPTVTTIPRWRMPIEVLCLVTLREHSDTFVRDDPWPGVVELSNAARRIPRLVSENVTRLSLAHPWLRRRRASTVRRALPQADRILFVCKGNIYRSAFAHHLAEQVLPPHVAVASCGYHPEPGRACPADAVDAAAEMGIDLRPHRSQVLSASMLHDADIVFVFDEDNYLTLRARHAWARAKIHFLGILSEDRTGIIRDPDGGSAADVRAAYQTIHKSVMCARRSIRSIPGSRAAGAPREHTSHPR
jgi:protein-tyrosine-phosphatase/predicted ATP-grasp superfamily ATP-dependent carboligase